MSQTGVWRYETRLMAVLCLMFGFVFFDRNAMSYLGNFVQPELGLTNTQVGMLSSGLSFAWALSGLAIGFYSDRSGKRKSVLLITVVIFSLCSVLSGLATSFAMLLAARMLMGLAEGGILPIAQSLVALESDPKRRGLNMGVMQNLGSNLIGSSVAPIVLVALAAAYGWRSSFFVAAVPGLVCAVLIWLFVREPTRQVVAAIGQKVGGADVTAEAGPMSVGQILRFRNIWLCIGMSCFMVAWMVLGWVFLPLVYANLLHIEATTGSWLMALLGISAAVFAFIVPGLSDKFGRKPVMIVFTLIGVIYPLAALHYSGSLVALGTLIFIGWSASGVFPIFMATIPSETIPSKYVATALGLVMGLGEIVGGTIGPTLAGHFADVYGLQAPLYMAIVCAAVATVFTLFLKETAPVKVGAGQVAASAAA
ncbi:MAG TPA: MFS transporter [Steroidobacteraceae bacterium]|nr:MFS transporter [Steroidobacteraceae bacterium]